MLNEFVGNFMLCKKAVSDVFLHSVCRKLTWQSLAELGVRDNFRDNATIQHLQWGRKWGINSVNLLNLTYPSHPPTHEEVAPTHRLTIYPDRQSISSLLENWTFRCPVLGSRYCTLRIYWNSWPRLPAWHPSTVVLYTAGVS